MDKCNGPGLNPQCHQNQTNKKRNYRKRSDDVCEWNCAKELSS